MCFQGSSVCQPCGYTRPLAKVPLPRGEAVDVSFFCGRSQELTTLNQWILSDSPRGDSSASRCRLVALFGTGGIGKTTLATKLAEQLQDQFEFLVWRSLRNALPLTDLLDELLKFLSPEPANPLPSTMAGKFSRLMEHLRQHRCLIVLDNLETLMQGDTYAGTFQIEYQDYGELLRRVGEVPHQSCLLLTSREKPNEIAMLSGEALPVRSLQLSGLSFEARELLTIKGLSVLEQESQQLSERYSGNPLALKIIATTIQELFRGDVSAFLEAGISSFNSINLLLAQQAESALSTRKRLERL